MNPFKPLLFILEGPDCCGKTTFAKQLADRIDAVYWHMTCTRTLAPAMRAYQMNAVQNAGTNLASGRCVVFDRLWPSEACYGPVCRPGTFLALDEVRKAVEPFEPIYIFCLDAGGVHNASARHALNLDDAHPYDSEVYASVYGRYEELLSSMQLDEQRTQNHEKPRRVMARYFDSKLMSDFVLRKHNDAFIDAVLRKVGRQDLVHNATSDQEQPVG